MERKTPEIFFTGLPRDRRSVFFGIRLLVSWLGGDGGQQFMQNFLPCPFKKNKQIRRPAPNGDPGVDAMLSVLAHEVVEAMSDPNLDAWYDATGSENGDKWCA